MIALGKVGVLFAPLCAFLANAVFTLGMRNSRAPHTLHSPAFLWSACVTWESVGKTEAWRAKMLKWKHRTNEKKMKKTRVKETGEGRELFGMWKQWSEIMEKMEQSEQQKQTERKKGLIYFLWFSLFCSKKSCQGFCSIMEAYFHF